MAPRSKKNNFTRQIRVLLLEVHKRKSIIFNSIRSGITGPAEAKQCEKIMSAVNAVSPEGHTVTEIKKKWFNMEMPSKIHLATAR